MLKLAGKSSCFGHNSSCFPWNYFKMLTFKLFLICCRRRAILTNTNKKRTSFAGSPFLILYSRSCRYYLCMNALVTGVDLAATSVVSSALMSRLLAPTFKV